MSYTDPVGKYVIFERKNGDGILDPEHFTVLCPHCRTQASGRALSRSFSDLATPIKWVVLPHGKFSTLYCSHQCALQHNPIGCHEHWQSMLKRIERLQIEAKHWHGNLVCK